MSDDLVREIEQTLRLKRMRESSIEQYLVIARRLPLTNQEVRAWVGDVGAHRHSFIIAVLKTFAELGFVEQECYEGIPIPRGKDLPDRVELRKDLLTEDEISLLIENASTTKDRAIIDSAFETYARAREWLTLERKHFRFYPDCIDVFIPISKSTVREVTLITSAANVKNWLIERGDHPGLFWFAKHEPRTHYKFKTQIELSEKEIRNITNNFLRRLKTIVRHAGIEKDVWTHLLRHSGITDALTLYDEQDVRETAGLSKKGQTIAKYSKFSSVDAKTKKKQKWGLANYDQKTLVLKVCPVCQTKNNARAERCVSCTRILSMPKLKTKEDEETFYLRVLEHPEVKEQILKVIKELEEKEKEKFTWVVPEGEFENGVCEFHCSEGCKDATDHHFRWLKREGNIAFDKKKELWYWVKKRDTRHPCLKENCRFYDRIDDRGNYFYCNRLGDYLDKETGICPIPKSKLIFTIKYCPHCKKEIKMYKKYLKDLLRCPECRNFFTNNYQLLDKLPEVKLECET